MIILKILLVAIVAWVSVFIGSTIFLLLRKYVFKVSPRPDQPSKDNNIFEVNEDDCDSSGDY